MDISPVCPQAALVRPQTSWKTEQIRVADTAEDSRDGEVQ